jgi:hypothetical protein
MMIPVEPSTAASTALPDVGTYAHLAGPGAGDVDGVLSVHTGGIDRGRVAGRDVLVGIEERGRPRGEYPAVRVIGIPAVTVVWTTAHVDRVAAERRREDVRIHVIAIEVAVG